MSTNDHVALSAAQEFPINLLPSESDFAEAELDLDPDREETPFASGRYFQQYVALIAICVRHGHRHVADIVGQLAPIVGSQNIGHVIWLIEILSGPAADIHLWDWEKPDNHMFMHGPELQLKPGLGI